MAMITCPNCGEQISDKAKSCVHCGVSLLPEEKVICEECGAELEEGIEICPSCGCPVTLSEDSSKGGLQQVEVAGVRMTNVTKKKMAIAIGIILLMAVVILVASLIQKKIVADKAQKTEKEYAVNLQTITKTMLDSADDWERFCLRRNRACGYRSCNRSAADTISHVQQGSGQRDDSLRLGFHCYRLLLIFVLNGTLLRGCT